MPTGSSSAEGETRTEPQVGRGPSSAPLLLPSAREHLLMGTESLPTPSPAARGVVRRGVVDLLTTLRRLALGLCEGGYPGATPTPTVLIGAGLSSLD